MFEQFLVGASHPRRITLQTHRGREIENEIADHPVPGHKVEKFNRIVDRHPQWRIRKPPTGVYNCFGHVWASRRTAVYDNFDEAVLKVRDDDGYRLVDWASGGELPCSGDVACYWEGVRPYRNCYHVGRVVFLETRKGLPPLVFVLSKWDDMSGEVLHEATDHPFPDHPILEFWTDRPNAAQPLGRILQ